MIKAVFFDIDGTLVSFQTHQVPASTQYALEALRAKGIKLFIATGRPPSGVAHIKNLLPFPFDGYITTNGQYCFNDAGVLHEQWIPSEDLANILPYLEEKQIACDFMELDYIYLNRATPRVLQMWEQLGDTAFKEPFDDPNRIFTHRTYQLSAFVDTEEEEAFFRRLPGCRSVRWHPLFMDVIPKEGGKATGILKCLEAYGISPEESMAFGDGGNDTEMFTCVHTGVAMGNAGKDVQRMADYVTDDVDHDGILNALKHFRIL
ncbi:Cof-type HAD-IIB family hydrolase [Anaeromassilibacillus senegalensis]|uniref:Cof-type HAD-IIB family hydrolase n=1 Tax=Anaeromassilibacillus senegalensis TaxID=1673717 RepID=UPI0006823644|nr:Cof-type HAD-IIB family hydrolase [Anaeromassilibacillus senegalensis]